MRRMDAHRAVNRRSFLKTSLAAGAAIAVVGVARAESIKPVRMGIIGTGSRGTSLLQTLLVFPGVEFHAVGDLVGDRASRAAELAGRKTGVSPDVYAGSENAWKHLLERDDLDAVIIATPWDLHARMAAAAMRAGKYPGVEVPAAMTLKECWELVRTSEGAAADGAGRRVRRSHSLRGRLPA